MTRRSGFGEVMKANSPAATPTAPVKLIEGASDIVSGRVQGGSCDVATYSSSVRTNTIIRDAIKPRPQTKEQTNAEHWRELHEKWAAQAEQEKREREARFTVTFDPISGVKTEIPK
jgi:hypothetical protein